MAASVPGSPGPVPDTARGDAPEKMAPSIRQVMSACALTLLRLLSYVATNYGKNSGDQKRTTSSSSSSSSLKDDRTNNTDNDGIIITSAKTNSENSTGTGTGTASAETLHPADPIHHYAVPPALVAITGSCLSRVAHEIDLAAGPRGAMASVLSLLLPPAGLHVREQAALALGAIAGQGYNAAIAFQAKASAAAAADGGAGAGAGGGGGFGGGGFGGGGFGGGGLGGGGFGGGMCGVMPEHSGGGREGRGVTLWRRFCAGVVGGTGAHVSETVVVWLVVGCMVEGMARGGKGEGGEPGASASPKLHLSIVRSGK